MRFQTEGKGIREEILRLKAVGEGWEKGGKEEKREIRDEGDKR